MPEIGHGFSAVLSELVSQLKMSITNSTALWRELGIFLARGCIHPVTCSVSVKSTACSHSCGTNIAPKQESCPPPLAHSTRGVRELECQPLRPSDLVEGRPLCIAAAPEPCGPDSSTSTCCRFSAPGIGSGGSLLTTALGCFLC